MIPFGMSAFNSSSIVIICANEAPFPPEMDSEHAFGSFKDKTLAKDDFDSSANFNELYHWVLYKNQNPCDNSS